MGEFQERHLDWSMASFGGTIEWSDCASRDPSDWDYADLEIFYMLGRCHHLAIALHRTLSCDIGVLFESDPDELEDPARPLPHHVFAVDGRGFAIDVRGRRTTAEVIEDFAGTVGLVKPEFRSFRSEAEFRQAVMERGDRCLRDADEHDIEAAARVVSSRLAGLAREHSALMQEYRRQFAR